MTADTVEGKERMKPSYYFIELETSDVNPDRCVDGRKCKKKPKKVELGYQQLGGSLQAPILKAIYNNTIINGSNVSSDLKTLRSKGFTLGVHVGSHKNHAEEKSDCGLADNLDKIIDKAQKRREEIAALLVGVYDDNKDKLEGQFTREGFVAMVDHAYEKIAEYPVQKVWLTGEPLVEAAQGADKDVNLDDLLENHGESVAFFNLKDGVTFDTTSANENGFQGFNLDYPAAKRRMEALGIEDDNFTLGASLILYVATEMVLVEDKGKARLPIEIHA